MVGLEQTLIEVLKKDMIFANVKEWTALMEAEWKNKKMIQRLIQNFKI